MKEENKYKLFLSYGHPEVGICKKIYDRLKKEGYNVWFDKTDICFSDDWRTKIYNGIKSSNGVIVCLSKHSTRDRSVCLDELRIAIAAQGGNISTILLDAKEEINVPATIRHRQWLDMSNWRDVEKKGEHEFARWFDEKMQCLLHVLKSEYNKEFSGDISFLREKLHVSYDASRTNMYLERRFIGREWLTEEIVNWVESDCKSSPICILCGEPGIGKTAFVVELMHHSDFVGAGILCEKKNTTINNAQVIIQTLAFLLACKLEEYRKRLCDVITEQDSDIQFDSFSAQELFKVLLADPLKGAYVDGGQENILLCVDALDEAEYIDEFGNIHNSLADILSEIFYSDNEDIESNRMPCWIKLLITTRKSPQINQLFASAKIIYLDGKMDKNIDDVKNYFLAALQSKYGVESYFDSAVESLVSYSDGIFLYANYMIRAISMNYAQLKDFNYFPKDLRTMFYRWFQWIFPNSDLYKVKYKKALGMIAVSKEPLPIDDLMNMMNWDEDEIADFYRKLSIFISINVNSYDEQVLSFDHAYIIEWILEYDMLNPYSINRRTIMRYFAKKMFKGLNYRIEKFTRYQSYYLQYYLKETGMEDEYQECVINHDWNEHIRKLGECSKSVELKLYFWSMYVDNFKNYIEQNECLHSEITCRNIILHKMIDVLKKTNSKLKIDTLFSELLSELETPIGEVYTEMIPLKVMTCKKEQEN